MKKKQDIFNHLKPGKISTPEESYFTQLASDIIRSQEVRVIPLYKKPILWFSAAAAVIAVLIVFNFNSSEENNDVLLALNEISSEELFLYVDENIEDFESDMLIEIIPITNIESVEFVSELSETANVVSSESTIDFEEINNEDILDYINSEEIDIFSLDDSEEFI